MNGRVVGGTQAPNPQTGLLYNLLEYDDLFQQTYLYKTNGWLKDRSAWFGNHIRHRFIEGSKHIKLYGQLNHNLFTTKQLLLPGITIDIRLNGTNAEFCLIRAADKTDKYKVVINECKLNVRRVLYNETILNHVNKLMAKGYVAKYPYTETAVHTFSIPQGSTTWRSPVFPIGPSKAQRIYFAIADSDCIDGSWECDPMVFPAAKYKLNYVQFYDNNEALMYKPYEPDFENENCSKSYAALIRIATDSLKTGRCPGIDINDFANDYGIFAIDKVLPTANMTIRARFKEATPELLLGLVFTQYDTYFAYEKSGAIKTPSYV